MRPLAVPIAAALLVVASPGHGAPLARGGEPKPKPPAHGEKAASTAQEHAYQQAVRQQIKAQQQMVKEYERAVHEQLKAQVQAHHAAHQGHPATSVPTAPPRSSLPGTFPLSSSGYLASPHHYGHSPHHYRSYRHRPYRHYRTWPAAQDPEYAALVHLRQTLDLVHSGSGGSGSRSSSGAHGGQRSAIEQALMRVVEVNQAPSVGAMNRLAGEVEEALQARSKPTIDTGAIALALRGGVNHSALIAAERVAVVHELQTAFKDGGVPPLRVAAVVAALHNVERQEQPQHARR